jgi:hypothetical protein
MVESIQMFQFRWKLTVFNRRVKAKVEKVNQKTKGLPKDSQRKNRKEKIPKENQKAMTQKGPREALVIDQRGKAKVKRGSAIIVVVQGTWPGIAGNLRPSGEKHLYGFNSGFNSSGIADIVFEHQFKHLTAAWSPAAILFSDHPDACFKNL